MTGFNFGGFGMGEVLFIVVIVFLLFSVRRSNPRP